MERKLKLSCDQAPRNSDNHCAEGLSPTKPEEQSTSRDTLFRGGYTDDLESWNGRLNNQKWFVNPIIALGNITLIYAPPGSGKTLLVMYWLMHECDSFGGENVWYFNADDSTQGGVEKAKMLAPFGIEMAAPDNPDKVLQVLDRAADTGEIEGKLIIFDTLKKFVPDMLNKKALSTFFKLMRKLTKAGATVIILGHANKHWDEKIGKPVFEGTGDIENDVDCLYRMYAVTPKDSKTQTVKMEVQKERSGQAQELLFRYDQPVQKLGHYREMLESMYFCTPEERQDYARKSKDEVLRQGFKEEIIFVRGVLKPGKQWKQVELLKLYKEDQDNWPFSRNSLVKALHQLIGIEWNAKRGKRNALLFTLRSS